MVTALQDIQVDSEWMPYEVFVRNCRIADKELQLHKERYKVLVVPPVEVIPFDVMAKVKEFFEAGGIVIGYGYLPSKSATVGRSAREIADLCASVWGEQPKPGNQPCRTSPAGGRSYFLAEETPTPQQLQQVLDDAGVDPTLKVLAGETNGWLHVLHRVKAGRDVFLLCNQNHEGAARQFKFRATATGAPECWDAMRNEITTIPFERTGENTVEFSLGLEPLESVLIIFQPKPLARPLRIEQDAKQIREPIPLTRDPNPPARELPPLDRQRPHTASPVVAADPYRGHFVIPADVDLSQCRICVEMNELPDQSAAVTVNGTYVGGVIGQPLRLDITRHVQSGQNTVVIEPLAPKSARIVVYGTDP